MTAPDTGGYIHHALFFGSDDDLLTAAVPFLRDELAPDEAAVLVCDDHNNELIAAELRDLPRLGTLPRGDIYLRTATAVAQYRRMMEEQVAAGVRRVRLVGEVDFGADPAGWDEWARFEAVCNVALAPYPLSSVCAYDTRTAPESLLAAARATHPHLLAAAGRLDNEDYRTPESVLRWYSFPTYDRLLEGPPLYEAEVGAGADRADVRALRAEARAALSATAEQGLAVSDFLAAVHETVFNGVRHGRPPVRVRVWAEPGRLACTVTDQGPGFDDVLAGYHPPRGPAEDGGTDGAGLGLWLARQLCDHLDMARTEEGFTVRLGTAIPAEAGPQAAAESRFEAAPLRAEKSRARARELLGRSKQQRL